MFQRCPAFRGASAFALALLVGCTSDIGPDARTAGVTAIRPNVGIVIPPMRIGFDAHTGNMTLMISATIVNAMYSKKLNRLAGEMQTNHIDVAQMVRERAVQILQEKGFLITNTADASFSVIIDQYGFDGAGLSLSKEVPFIVLKAKLFRGGEKIWSGEGQAHPLRSSGLGAALEEYYAHPELLREHWEIQIDRALRQLLTAKK